nr:MAG TPA: hypothetical protein [Caudoviricetes sp.]
MKYVITRMFISMAWRWLCCFTFLKTAQRCCCFPVFGQLGCSCVVYLVVNRSFTFLNSSAVGLNSSPLYSM